MKTKRRIPGRNITVLMQHLCSRLIDTYQQLPLRLSYWQKLSPLFGQPQMCHVTYISVFTLCSVPFQSTNISMQEFSVYKNRQTSLEFSFPTRRHPCFRSINFYNTEHTISSSTESYELDFCSLVRPSFAIQKRF